MTCNEKNTAILYGIFLRQWIHPCIAVLKRLRNNFICGVYFYVVVFFTVLMHQSSKDLLHYKTFIPELSFKIYYLYIIYHCRYRFLTQCILPCLHSVGISRQNFALSKYVLPSKVFDSKLFSNTVVDHLLIVIFSTVLILCIRKRAGKLMRYLPHEGRGTEHHISKIQQDLPEFLHTEKCSFKVVE